MNPISQKSTFSKIPEAHQKSNYTLEKLPTAIQKIISSFISPKEAFTGSPASKLVHKMLHDNSVWQTFARTLNIKLEDPKNARSELVNLFKSINNYILKYLPESEAKRVSAVVDPFAQNKEIEKYLEAHAPTASSKTDTFQMLAKLTEDLTKKSTLSRTEIETVRMFIKNGALNFPLTYGERADTLRKIVEKISGAPPHTRSEDFSFPHPELIPIIFDKMKENKFPVDEFSSMIGGLIGLSPGMDRKHRTHECLETLLKGCFSVIEDLDSRSVVLDFSMLSEEQWPIMELVVNNTSLEFVDSLENDFTMDFETCFYVATTITSRRSLKIKKSLLEQVVSQTAQKNLGVEMEDKIYLETRKILKIVDCFDDSKGPEKLIAELSTKLSLDRKQIAEIVNTHWDLAPHKKQMKASYAHLLHLLSVRKG